MKKFLIKAVRFYQKRISPAKKSPCCRFYPTCSAYTIEALEIHGAVKGSLLSFWRILRCNPLCKGGIDLVPPKQEKSCVRRKNNPTNQDGV